MSMLDWALLYAEKKCAVFPLLPRSKQPATDHGFYDASTDPEQIKQWWEENPNYNIAIATGDASHGLYVIDIDDDPKKGKHGSETLRKWEIEHGPLPETLTAVSGSGGYHYYYRTRDQYQKAENIGGQEHIDVRANGGYIVAPPSIHPGTGKPYKWLEGLGPEDRAPAMLSGSAKELAELGKKEKPKDEFKTTQTLAETFGEGTRTKALVSVIGSLKRKGFTDEEIRKMIEFVNESRCSPPLTDRELEREVFPAFKRNWKIEAPFWNDQYIEELPEPFLLSEVLENPPALAPPLIDGVLRQGHKMILSGPSKAGKSFALMELAIAIAEGMAWFGNGCTQGKVLYINMEIDRRSCIHRFKKIYEASSKFMEARHPDNREIRSLRGHSRPLNEMVEQIIQTAKHKYIAIILDPLYKLMTGDENSNSDVGKMVENFDRITEETGASVIYAHHFAKGSSGDKDVIDRAAGAGTFARDPDAIVTLSQIYLDDDVNKLHTGWRVEYILREYPNKEPYNVWFNYPLHEYDPDLERENIVTSSSKKDKRAKDNQERKKDKQKDAVEDIVQKISDNRGRFKFKQFFDWYQGVEQVSDQTVRRRLTEAGYGPDPTAPNGSTPDWLKLNKDDDF